MRTSAYIRRSILMPAIERTTQIFKALSEPTRLRIVRLMAANNAEVCVCELVDCLEEPQYHVSRHLRELRESELLASERDGRWVYYRLSENSMVDELARFVLTLPGEVFEADQKNFEVRMSLRSCGRCRIGIQKVHLSDSPTTESMAA